MTAIVLVVIVLAVVMIFAYFPPQKQATVQTTTTAQGVTPGNVAGLIAFVVSNPLSGTSASPTTFRIYPASGSVVGGQTYGGKVPSESVTISSGTGTTAQSYTPGITLYILGELSGSQNIMWKVTAPGVTTLQAAYGTAAQVSLALPAAPTLSLSITDDKGNVYKSGSSINFTDSDTDSDCAADSSPAGFCVGETSVTLTLTITNIVANTGYISSYDPINAQDWCSALVATEGGTDVNKIGVSGFPSTYGAFNVGTIRNWQTTLPDGFSPTAINPILPNNFADTACSTYSTATGGLSTQTQGSTNVGGTVIQKFVIKQNSLGVGDSLTLSFQPWLYYDPVYSATNSGNGGATAATSGSPFVLTVDA